MSETEQFDVAVVDSRTAQVLGLPKFDEGFMHIMTRLHVDLFAGLPGMLFLGAMGFLLVIAIISGVVLYAPFMRRSEFGTVRRERSSRVKWLDLHNLLGIVTVMWAGVVGLTGIVNTLALPALNHWQTNHLTPFIAQYHHDAAPVPPNELASLERAVRSAEASEPGMVLSFVAFPGAVGSSNQHYAIYMRGDTPLTSRLYKPVLAEGRTGQVVASVEPPWYLNLLYLSQPLHFGDYAGMPLKIIWALFDLVTIVVLGSGLYLWLKKSARTPAAEKPEATAARRRPA